MPDKPGPEGLSQEDLDALKAAEGSPPTFSNTPSQAELDRLAADGKGGMRIEDVANFETFPAVPDGAVAPGRAPGDQGQPANGPMTAESVANFETFPPVPDSQFVSQLDDLPKRPGFLDGVDMSKPWTTFDEEAAKARLDAMGSLPMTIESVANFETYPTVEQGEEQQRKAEQLQREIEEAENEVAQGGRPGGGVPRSILAVGAGVVLIGLAFVAMLARGGSTPSASNSTGAATTAAIVGTKGGAGVPWPGCTAAPVPASAAEAIPRDKRFLVAAYCFGGHYYPTEQFQWSSAPGCTEPGVIGNASHLVTKSGGPAQAIDDPAASLADPRPGGCGFLAMYEAPEQEKAIQGKFPEASGNMFPAHTDTYRAFQARAGLAR